MSDRHLRAVWSAATFLFLGGASTLAAAAATEELVGVVSSQSSPASVVRIEPRSGVLSVTSVDLRVQAGAISLAVQRIFEADAGGAGLLGRGWRLNWERRLSRKDGLAGVRGPSGTLLLRREGTSDKYLSPQGNEVVFAADGAVHTLPDGRREKYDAQGRLVELDARNGNKVRVEYDAAGRLAQVTGPFGSFFKFSIDARGRLAHVESSTGVTVRYFYGGDAIPDDQRDTRVAYSYDDGLRLTSLEHPQAGAQRFAYDVYGRVVERRYADDAVERRTYDDAAHTVQMIDAAGRTSTLREAADGASVEWTTAGGARSRVEFDPQRRPASFVGATGLTTRLTYDSESRISRFDDPVRGVYGVAYQGSSQKPVAITFPDGRRLDVEYDDRGNPLRVQYDGDAQAEWAATYRGDGLPEAILRRGEKWLTLSYDERGRLNSLADALGARGTLEYDAAGRVVRYVDPAGGAVEREYDDAGRLATITDALGGVTKLEYGAASRPVKMLDPLGNATTYAYDARGRLTTRTDPLERTVRYAYHPDGRLQSATDASGGPARFEYDADGRLTRYVNAAGGADRFTFDMLGNLTSVDTAAGATWKAAYDELGRRTDVTDPAGNVFRMKYDRLGRIVGRTDPYGRTTQYEYDRRGNLVQSTDPDGRVAARKYDAADRLVELSVDGRPRATFDYDDAGRVAQVSHAAGLEVTYRRDPLGRVSEWQDNLGGRGKIVRDAEGRPIEQVDAAGAIVRRRFDALGRLVVASDALGRAQARKYDAAGQVTERIVPNGDAVKYEYDAVGRVAKVRTAGGGERTYQYDALGLPIRAANALGQVSRATYDPAGRLVTSTDAAGRTTTLVYDAVGRIAERRRSDGSTIRYRYDDRGRLAEVDDGAFPVRYAYDEQGRRAAIEYPAVKQTIRYTYSRGRLESVTAAGRTIQYAYDEWDRVATLDAGGGAIRFQYDARGRTTGIDYPNGVKAVREFDVVGRVKKLVYTDRDGRTIAGGEYVYDPIGNETEATDVGGAVTIYGYDVLGQLTSEDRGAQGRAMYMYSADGNRTEFRVGGDATAYEYDRADRLMKAGAETFRFDDVGRLAERKAAQGTTTYEYDADGRLAAVVLASGQRVSYGYAPTGERVWREVDGKRTWYLTDGLEVLAELGDDLIVRATYLQGPGIDQVLALTRGEQTLYVHADRRGSIRALTDADAKIAGTYQYDAFGRILAQAGAVASPFHFTGREFDEATGLYYFRARWYDPALGRFLTKDPQPGSIDEPLSLNPYQYVVNNPLRRIDPLGTEGVNPNVTMDSPLAVTMDTVPPELAVTAEMPMIDPNVTMDTPATPMSAYEKAVIEWWRGGATGPRPSSPGMVAWRQQLGDGSPDMAYNEPAMRGRDALSNQIRATESQIEAIRTGYEQEAGRYEQAGKPIRPEAQQFWDETLAEAQAHLDDLRDEATRRSTGQPARDWYYEGLRNVEAETARMTGGAAEPAPVVAEPAPPVAVAAAAAEEAGLWSRLANAARGAVDGFFEPKASTGNVAGGVGLGFMIGGNVMIDVLADGKELSESLRDQGIGALVALPVVIVVTAAGGGEALLVVGVGATIKRGYDALSGDATVLAGPEVTRRDMPSTAGARSATAGNVGAPTFPRQARPLTPTELADLNRYVQGLAGPGGAAMVVVPSLIGLPVQAASPMLGEAKLGSQPLVGKEAPTEKQQFQVYYQKPEAGALVAAGTAVEVMFYNKAKPSKETVKAPNVVGLSRAEADAALAKVKLTGNGTAGKEKPPTSAKREQVYSQNPKAGAEVFVGDAVKYEYYAGIPVGKYVGLSKDDAVREITALGLKPVVIIGEARAAKESDRMKIYQQNPQAGAYAWYGDSVEITHYKNSEGFQDGDGKLVDGRVAGATVKDGDGGPRSIIEFTLLPAGNPELNHTVMWKIEKFATTAAANAAFNQSKAVYDQAVSFSGPYGVVEKKVGATNIEMYTDLNTDRAQQTSKQHVFLYRGQFQVIYIYQVPQYKADVSHAAKVVENSKKLIDLRFPED